MLLRGLLLRFSESLVNISLIAADLTLMRPYFRFSWAQFACEFASEASCCRWRSSKLPWERRDIQDGEGPFACTRMPFAIWMGCADLVNSQRAAD